MRKPQILISIDTRKNLVDKEFSKFFLSDWFEKYSILAPAKAESYEPIRTIVNDASSCLPIWTEGSFIWKRTKSIASTGTFQDGGRYFCSAFRIRSSWKSDFEWEDFFDWLCYQLEPSFGYIHLITDRERNEPTISSDAAYDFFLGAHMKIIEQDGIPNLGWKTFLGNEVISSQNLKLNGPGSLRMTTDIADVLSDYEKFSINRLNVIKKIGMQKR